MDFSIYQSRLRQLINERNGYLVLSIGGLLISFLLLLVIFSLVGREKTIIVPPVIEKEFWVTNSSVSPEYLTQMTKYYALLKWNVNPENVDDQQHYLLENTASETYGSQKLILAQESEKIKKDNISMSFWPVETQVDSKHLKVLLKGNLKVAISSVDMPIKQISYLFTYQLNAGKLKISSIAEVKDNA